MQLKKKRGKQSWRIPLLEVFLWGGKKREERKEDKMEERRPNQNQIEKESHYQGSCINDIFIKYARRPTYI